IHDALVAGAAAQIAGERDAHLAFGGIGVVAQELDQRRENSRRAEAALQAVIVAKGFLQRMQLVGAGRDALDGENLVAVSLHGQHEAGARREAVEQDRAGAAYAVLAAEMRSGEAEMVADEIRQGEADLHLLLVAGAVDSHRDGAFLGHVRTVNAWPPSRRRAAARRLSPAPGAPGRRREVGDTTRMRGCRRWPRWSGSFRTARGTRRRAAPGRAGPAPHRAPALAQYPCRPASATPA